MEQSKSELYDCKRCGPKTILHLASPPLPEGYIAGAWEGWFHLDKTREHFCSVGWYQLTKGPTSK